MKCLITSYTSNRKTGNEVFQQINKYLNHCSLWNFPAILFSLSASYNIIIFYELALSLVICPFPAILFSLAASYKLIIFYELALLLVIFSFPAQPTQGNPLGVTSRLMTLFPVKRPH